MRREIEKRMVK